MSLQQLWQNVNLGLRASNRQQWNYITFFPQSFLTKHNWYLFKYIITILVQNSQDFVIETLP